MTGPTDTVPIVRLGDLHVHARFKQLLEGHGLSSLNAVMTCGDSRLLDKPGLDSYRQRVRLVLDGQDDENVLYVKRYTAPHPGVQIRRLLSGVGRHGTAWVEWRWLMHLAAAGVAVPTPVAFGERLTGWLERGSALVMASAPGESLETWASRRPDRCDGQMVRDLADFVRRFHAAGCMHRDLYLSHVFFDPTQTGPDRFCMIDLQRVITPTWRRMRWVVKDLAALHYSTPVTVANAADRVRFLRRYLGVRRLGPRGHRLAARIEAKAERISRHDSNRARWLASRKEMS